MLTVGRRTTPLRLALVWGAAAGLLALLGVVLYLWTGWATDSGTTCSPPSDGDGAACRLFGAWAPLLTLAAVLGGAALLAAAVGIATEHGPRGRSTTGGRGGGA